MESIEVAPQYLTQSTWRRCDYLLVAMTQSDSIVCRIRKRACFIKVDIHKSICLTPVHRNASSCEVVHMALYAIKHNNRKPGRKNGYQTSRAIITWTNNWENLSDQATRSVMLYAKIMLCHIDYLKRLAILLNKPYRAVFEIENIKNVILLPIDYI